MNVIARLLIAVYRLTLLRYPSRLRRDWGDEMVWAFERSLRDARNTRELARAAVRTFRDVLRPIPQVHVPGSLGRSDDAPTPGATDDAPSRTGPPAAATGFTSFVRRHLRGWHQDLGYAVRGLAREPRFSAVVTGVLGIGIGLFTVVFAVVNAYLIRPLPFPEADRIVSVQGTQGRVAWTQVGEVFDRAVSWDLDVFILTGDGGARLTTGAWVTADFLDTYGVEPALGRRFDASEAVPGGPQVAIISHRLWLQRFGGAPDVLGTTFRAYTSDRPDHAESFTVVGVLPEDFWYFNDYTDVLVPLREDRALYVGRLRAGVPIERARQHVERLAADGDGPVPAHLDVPLVRLQEQHTESLRPTLALFQTAVLLVLLISCANVAVLFLVRSARRARELGIRKALGAHTPRLARQLLLEGVLLAALAAVLGTILAWGGLELLDQGARLRLGRSVPGGAEALRIDGLVLAATALLGAVVGVVFGLVPLVTARGTGLLTALVGAPRSGESRTTRRFRGGMVVAEVALSLALLTVAGLVVRSALHLETRDLGFEPDRLERGVVGVREASYPTPEELVAFFEELTRHVQALPTVESVGLIDRSPFTTRFGPRNVETDGASLGEAVRFAVDEGYFPTVRGEIVRGRDLAPSDRTGGPPVTLVSERLANDLWPGQDPLGRRLRALPFDAAEEPGDWHTVVGVVADIEREVGGSRAGAFYVPYRQAGVRWMNVVTRVRPGAGSVMPDVAGVLEGLDPTVALSSVTWMDDAVARAVAPVRFAAMLMGGFAVLAGSLALIGLYGVVSYAARQSRRDVAIRKALGADGGRAAAHLLRHGALMVGLGVPLGLVGSAALVRLLRGQLFGVSSTDPLTYALSVLVLGGAAGLAVWLPARDAVRTHPMSVLREE